MIKYIIVDDESIPHDIIKGYCDLLPNMHFQTNCHDAIEALQYLKSNEVDLIFLDLNMPKLKGFDFLKTLINPPQIIITTAYSEFALEGYELNVVDYLLKPFSFERFLKAVQKVKTTENKTNKTNHQSQPSIQADKIFITSNKKYFQLNINEILFIEASGNYCKIVTQQQTISTRSKISSLLKKLSQKDFIQVHKSFAVAVQHIKSIEGNLIKIKDHNIPIGKIYKMNLNKILKL